MTIDHKDMKECLFIFIFFFFTAPRRYLLRY